MENDDSPSNAKSERGITINELPKDSLRVNLPVMSCGSARLLRDVALGLFVLSPALIAQVRPRGIYSVVDVENEIATLQAANPSITASQLDAGFNSFYQHLLSNPAVAGLAIRPHWDTLNPNSPGTANAYYWNLVDDAFTQAAWNAQNPAQTPKTIQLIVTPRFNSPAWLLSGIPSCDGLFQTPVVTPHHAVVCRIIWRGSLPDQPDYSRQARYRGCLSASHGRRNPDAFRGRDFSPVGFSL